MENEALQYPLEITLRMHGGTNGGIIFTIKNKSIQINILISLKSRPQAGFLMPADYVPRLKHQRFFAGFSASLSCSMLTVRCLGSCLIAFCSADQN